VLINTDIYNAQKDQKIYGILLGTDIRYNNYTMKYGIMVYTGIIPWR
jgi:hypothetical protein